MIAITLREETNCIPMFSTNQPRFVAGGPERLSECVGKLGLR